jgi:LPS O-antigen subunit length determinant protein (WzzB/FepE family)
MEKYHVRPIEINELNEEYYRMQKLAGLITEKQYNTHIQYKDYLENISKSFEKLKQTLTPHR